MDGDNYVHEIRESNVIHSRGPEKENRRTEPEGVQKYKRIHKGHSHSGS